MLSFHGIAKRFKHRLGVAATIWLASQKPSKDGPAALGGIAFWPRLSTPGLWEGQSIRYVLIVGNPAHLNRIVHDVSLVCFACLPAYLQLQANGAGWLGVG